MKALRTILTFGILLGGIWVSRADVLEQWYWRNPLPQGNELYNVVFANNRFVALGELGTILTSLDGTNWATSDSGITMELRDCAYGNGTYVAVGDYGTVLTSPDATNWTTQYPETFFSLKGIAYATGKFVCVGEQGTILTSTDGVTWTQRSSGPWELRDVIYAEGLFLAAGGAENVIGLTSMRVLLASSDGATWTIRVLAYGQPFDSLAIGGGTFAATTSGDPWYGITPVWSSNNGLDWQPAPPPLTPVSKAKISYGNGLWVLVTGRPDYTWLPGEVLTSADLVSWTSRYSNSVSILGVCFGAGKFIAARADGTLLASSNGWSWQDPQHNMGTAILNDLAFLNGKFLGLAYERSFWSSNGIGWTTTPAPTNTGNLFNVAYGEGRYVAGGELRMVWTSTNGLDWINPATNLSSYPYSSDVRVAYGNGVFVGAAGQQGDILTSDDGDNWTVQSLITNANDYVYFRDITFANGRFVAVSETATATSMDGTNWFIMRTNLYLFAVTGGAGKFVAVGGNTIATSTDGLNWSAQTLPDLGPSVSVADVAFGAGWFVASTTLPNYSSNPPLIKQPGVFWVSSDGYHWSRRTSPASQGLGTIAFGDGTFVVGTQNGGILQSDPMVTLSMRAALPPQLEISGPLHRQYQIERCDMFGLTNEWSSLGAVTITNDPGLFTDGSGTNSAGRFYRAVLLP